MKTEILNRLLQDRKAKRQFALLTNLETGDQALVYPVEIHGDLTVDEELRQAAMTAIEDDRSATHESAAGDVFIQVYNPPLRMIIVGAVHIAQPLSTMASLAGFQVTIIDPRAAYLTAERFPDLPLVNDWPDVALAGLKPEERTAVVVPVSYTHLTLPTKA